MKKLLLIGSNAGNAHLKHFLALVRPYFEEVLVVSDAPVDFAPSAYVSFSLKHPFQIYKSIRQLSHIIQAFQPTVIHVHQANSYAFIAGQANHKSIPLVLTAWGSDVLLLPKKSIFHRWLVKKGLQSARFITADAITMKEAIHNLGIDTEVILANFGVSVDLSSEIPKQRTLTLYSNRMHEPLYQIGELMEGLAESLSCMEGELIIAGRGSLTESLQQRVRALGMEQRIRFVGFVDAQENRAFYLQSRFFVSIPTSDGTSISLLEAMAYGCIPIVSDLPSNREWISDNVNGILVQSHETLGSALQRGLKLDGNAVINFNRDLIAKHGTKEVNAQKFIAIYEAVLRSKITV